MELTPEMINRATEYWKLFRKLPIGDAEMITHLATFANNLCNQTDPNLEIEIDEILSTIKPAASYSPLKSEFERLEAWINPNSREYAKRKLVELFEKKLKKC